jgi:hypothetical protein
MRPKTVYLLLAVLGAIIPYARFVPWLMEHGLDLPLFFDQLQANRISEFFAADVMVSGAAVIAFLISERRRLRGRWWLPIAGLMLFGVSVGLPLLLHLRERDAALQHGV